MAVISLNIPDASISRVVDAFAHMGGWNANMGLTKAQFAKAQLIAHMRATVVESETRISSDAAAAARQAAINEVQALDIT
jgi:hypothetical protein